MPRGSGAKRERQYEHIKDSAEKRGASPGRAKEMASRTVNKQRAQAGETKSGSSSKSSKASQSSSRSSSRSGGGGGATREELYAEAKRKDISGRSTMTKEQLARALGRR
jgi:hypothetical protein